MRGWDRFFFFPRNNPFSFDAVVCCFDILFDLLVRLHIRLARVTRQSRHWSKKVRRSGNTWVKKKKEQEKEEESGRVYIHIYIYARATTLGDLRKQHLVFMFLKLTHFMAPVRQSNHESMDMDVIYVRQPALRLLSDCICNSLRSSRLVWRNADLHWRQCSKTKKCRRIR